MSDKVQVNQERLGDYCAICDTCGIKFWASTMKRQWDGQFVDDKCWEPYPEYLKTKVIVEDRTVPIARPRKYLNNTADYAPVTASSPEGFLYTEAL